MIRWIWESGAWIPPAMILAGVMLFLLLAFTANHLSFPGARAEIEALRADLSKLDNRAVGEDVLGQATQWNQRIRGNQAYNKLWWSGWLTPDGWDEIELLPIPCSAEKK